MTILDKPIAEIEASDILLLCQEQQPEGAQFEIKRDLPTKDGKPADYVAIGDYARNGARLTVCDSVISMESKRTHFMAHPPASAVPRPGKNCSE